MTASLPCIRNSIPVPRSLVPHLESAIFFDTIKTQLLSGMRIVSYFGFRESGEIKLMAILAPNSGGSLTAFSCSAPHETASLANDFPQIQLFEREIAEQFGINFTGHPWFKPVRFHKPFPPAADLFARQIGDADYLYMHGDEVHEVAVGPVHAGVIEPGHFRFQCHGETVFHLEISLGYQHRGVEQLLIGGPRANSRFIIETLAGDTTIGHTLAYCQLMEALGSCDVSLRAHTLRAIALELERCANHIGDVGMLSGDVGYLPTAAYCGRIRGDALNASAILCGSRFGRSFLQEGGVQFDCESDRCQKLLSAVDGIHKDFVNAADLLWNEPSVLARFEETGTVSLETVNSLGIVGPAARASGSIQDVRQDFPFGAYQFSQIPVVSQPGGDVFARAFIRYEEVLRSLNFIKDQVTSLPAGETTHPVAKPAADSLVVSLTEAWRGEVCHTAITGKDGSFIRYKIVDPSFHNWNALAMSLRNEQISDFPLCNKSFNLSYCGYDL